MIDIDKQYYTVGGATVTIYTINGVDEDYPIVGHMEGYSNIMCWNHEGKCTLLAHRGQAHIDMERVDDDYS